MASAGQKVRDISIQIQTYSIYWFQHKLILFFHYSQKVGLRGARRTGLVRGGQKEKLAMKAAAAEKWAQFISHILYSRAYIYQ